MIERRTPRGNSATHPLPEDLVYLPITTGALLVSRRLATFCALTIEQVAELQATNPVAAPRAGGDHATPGGEGSLSEAVAAKLRHHGFFDPPRPAESDLPTVQLQITNACNINCSYCCTNSGAARQAEVSLEQALALAQEIRQQLGSGASVAVLGGEPLLVPWALTLCEKLVTLGLSLTLFTNGVPLADDSIAREAAALNLKGMEIRVSLAGPTSELCDQESGGLRFEAALAGVQRLAQHGGAAVVDLMLFPSQVEAVISEFPGLRRRLPEGCSVALGLAYHSGRETGQHFFGSPSALEDALDRIAFGAGQTIPAPRRSPLANRREGCGCAMGHHLHVRSDGALFPCFKMEERVGHIEREGFAATLKTLRDNPHPAAGLDTCRDCPLATLCGGGCRSDNLLWTGDPDRPVCGPWRVRLLSELLAEERVSAVDWPLHFLLAEAHQRGIDGIPQGLTPAKPSRHLEE